MKESGAHPRQDLPRKGQSVAAAASGPSGSNSDICAGGRVRAEEVTELSRVMLSVGIEIDDEFNRFVLKASPEAMKYRCAKPGARPVNCSGRNAVTPTEAFAKLDESFVATVVDEQDVHFPSKSRHHMTTLSDLLYHGIHRAEFAHCCEQDHASSHSRATLHQGVLFLRK